LVSYFRLGLHRYNVLDLVYREWQELLALIMFKVPVAACVTMTPELIPLLLSLTSFLARLELLSFRRG
jgi:hypothetical protein